MVVIGAAGLLATTEFDAPFEYVDLRAAETATAEYETSSYTGVWALNRALPPGSVIGSWDAGVIGYFSRFPVVNLDGVVNSWDYWRTTGRRNMARRGAYDPAYEKFGITHLANHTARIYDNTIFTGPIQWSQWQGADERFVLAAAPAAAARAGPRGKDYSAQLWASLAPHFDYSEGDVGLAWHGPVALAVARNCAPEELIVWSWDIPGARPVFQPGTNTGRGPGELCVSNAALPPGTPADSARAAAMPAGEYLTRLRAQSLPSARNRYDVYLMGNRLIYTREECSEADLESFFLFLEPAAVADLPAWRRQYGFDNLGFDFRQYGMQGDGVCLVNFPLPGYAISQVRTGQHAGAAGNFEHLWEEEFPTELSFDEMLARVDLRKAALPPRDYLAMLAADREPLIRADYAVYRVANRLIYAREQCRPEAEPAIFFLHVYPRDPATLPEVFRDFGYDNRDFEFAKYGVQADGMCLANVPLPPQDIVRIRTGQFVKMGGEFSNLWEEEVWTGEPLP